ncbi:hypothetical protein [Sphingobacterium sp. SGR-19]|uniref:hypothetical protein n=1 Tax=Sphingobacterium sp. SGR-19 TaxID=2710886 RepID=UPI0013EC26C2|nr:hypothetical protein [Sphingobacterium sp. SGR-19]NGM66309.1 hypothetical protein [Sphingobacterium sp. SGR-19]
MYRFESRKKIKQQLVFLEAAFKLEENVELPDMGERFSIDIADFHTAVYSHNEDLRALHRLVVEELQWCNDWQTIFMKTKIGLINRIIRCRPLINPRLNPNKQIQFPQ